MVYLAWPAGAGAGTGVCAGASIGGGVLTLEVTLDIPARLAKSVMKSDVKAKVPASTAVNFFMKSDPEGVLMSESPPPPPNTASPAPRPVCRRTTRIMSRQAETWTNFNRLYKNMCGDYTNKKGGRG